MKADRIQNGELIKVITGVGHTQMLAIGDVGLPIPPGMKTVDLSLVKGIPAFRDVLAAVMSELVVESCYVASEVAGKPAQQQIADCVGTLPVKTISHEQLKAMLPACNAVIRTGEATPYANIILVGGVNF